MNKIEVKNVEIENKTIKVDYEVSKELELFFNLDNKFKIEYGEDMTDVPEEIAIIPFISNVLPIIWLTNSCLVVNKLDKNYYESIQKTKEAFQNIYPNVKFEGEIKVKEIIETKIKNDKEENKSVFFSGGIDSVSSLVSVISQKPLLITIWGTDVWDHNEE